MTNLNVTFGSGKYGIVESANGNHQALRHGEIWDRIIDGNELMLSFARDLHEVGECLAETAVAVFGSKHYEPDVYGDYDRMLDMLGRINATRPKVPAHADKEGNDGPYALFLRDTKGEFTLMQMESGGLRANRFGEPHGDVIGDGMLLALGQDLEDARTVLHRLSDVVFGRVAGDEPDVYADTEQLKQLRAEILKVLPGLDIREVVEPVLVPGK